MMKSSSSVQTIIRGLVLTFLFALGISPGQAQQDLHIYYDAFHETFRAMRGDKEVEEYSVRKGNQIFLHTENYNNFIYELEVLQRNKPTANKTNMGFTSLMSMLSPTGGLPTDIFSGLAGGSGSADMFENLFPKASGYMDGADIQVQQLMSAYDASISNIRKLEKNINVLQNELKEIEDNMRNRNQILAYINDLKYNPNIPPVKIGELITKELESLLPKGDARITTSPRQQALDDMIRVGEKYRAEVSKLAELDAQAQQIDESTPKLKTLKTLIHDSHRDTKLVAEALTAQEGNLRKEVARDAGKEFQIQATIRQEYEAIINNSFSHTYRTQANDSDLELQVIFIARDSTNRPVSSGRQEIAPININVYGGLQINASVGVNFGQFGNSPQTYFVRDSFLRAENESNFIPFLTTSVHFYFQSRKKLSFGGTFGVGMALSNSENLETPTFFLGPSVIIGKNQSFTVSMGAMGGRIRRLSQGYQVGDRYSSDANVVPTKTKYELGYYVGISFNMGG
ncbi:MAG: hypothetical protein K9I85_10985 [Saprospiraceae bacterium]|nr:hypothetical protein [Saprospiraceae bacterium]